MKNTTDICRELQLALGERTHELACLYVLEKAAATCGNVLDELFQIIVELVPCALIHPEDTGCTLSIGGKNFSGTSGSSLIDSFQADITVRGRKAGELLAGRHSASGPEPFTPGEKHLISMVASWTGNIINDRQTRPIVSESDNRLAQIVHSNPIATFVIDAQHRTTHWNRACENLTGVPAADVIGTGKHWKAFYAEEKPVLADFMVDQTPEEKIIEHYGGNAHRSIIMDGAYEAEFFFPDLGTRGRWLYFTASPLKNIQGDVIGAIETLQDVTQRREMEEELRCELAGLEQELKNRFRFQNIIGQSSCMQKMYALLEDLVATDTTVLIQGESGTGKELVAKALHYSGERASKPMVTVNCSALTESLLASELFGHAKGAFTGAFKDKIGRFELAEGGTILLDEIGDIPAGMQVKLLRVLQEKEFERVGESTPRKADVRVLAATNRNLAELVRTGAFREDLYYRLKVIEVKIPPLRERLDDMPLLLEHFISLFNQKYKKEIKRVSKEVLALFMKHAWPGNVRELEHALEHAFILCHGPAIMLNHLPTELLETPGPAAFPASASRLPSVEQVLHTLRQTGWNKAKAARLLAISRPTLYRLFKKYGLHKNPEQV
jgi:transcriptional regulator with PAS, ATPase and Fis domain